MTAIIIMILLITACSNEKSKTDNQVSKDNLENINESGMPIVDDPITLDFFVGLNPGVEGNLNEISSMKKYTEMSNININWEEIAYDSIGEKRNLALASGNLPDAFYGADLPTSDIFKYAQQGTFIKLNDLIDKHAPNLKKVLDEYPDIRRAITYPDGNIYSLPYLRSPEFVSAQAFPLMYFNQETLEAVGMDKPETTEEFYQYLKALKEQEPEIIPFGSTGMYTLIGWLEGSFGIGNNRGALIDRDPENGDMRFVPITENYKEMLQYVNKLYTEDLIDKSIYTIEWNQYLTNAAETKYGSTVFYDPTTVISKEAGEVYKSAIPFLGPNGDQQITLTTYVFNIGTFAITNTNENPVATIKWADYFYSDEGAKLRFMGVEGESYEEISDGQFELTEKITNNPDGLQTEEALRRHAHYLTSLPDPGLQKQEYFKGSETAPTALEAVKNVEPYINPEQGWPPFTFTEEENKKLPALNTDISKYVTEMQAKFITGDTSFSEWDEYVETLEQMGLDEYMEIQKDALERFENN